MLIEGVTVEGASDAGIYVGQCENIVVRNSTAIRNVAGIEIENSRHADVHDNLATHNTGGILVFDLPNLPRGSGGDNDQANFAPVGNIVAQVRRGTGVLIMANDTVWVARNQLSGNATANVMVISYRNPFTDTKYNPLPRRVQVMANTMGRSGFEPQLPGGAQLAAAMGGALPPVLWDGTPTEGLRADAPVLSLGLAQGAAPETAKPAPAKLDGAAVPERAAVLLPASMEAAAR